MSFIHKITDGRVGCVQVITLSWVSVAACSVFIHSCGKRPLVCL